MNGQRNDVIWAALRLGVKRVMYVNANSSVMRNALDLSQFGAKDQISVTIGVATKATVAVDAASFGTGDVTYTLVGTLPQGVSFNNYTGAFSGTPVENGTYQLMISLAADGGWIKDTKIFTLTVKNDMFELTGMEGKVGEEFSGKIDSEALREDEADVAYRAENLPEGIILNGDGTFTGTPAAAGSYEVTVIASAQTAQQGSGFDNPFGGGSSNEPTTTEYIIHTVIEIAE